MEHTSISCDVIVDNKYKKILSKSAVVRNDRESKFIITLQDSYELNTDIVINIKFDYDEKETRIEYKVDDDNNLNIICYNIINNNNSNSYTIFSSMKKIIEINDYSVYIEPKITVYANGFKEILIDLYSELK